MQNKNFGDEIQRLLRYAQKRRFSLMEQKRIESEITLQTYLRSLIQTDKERRMQVRIEKYLEEKEATTSPSAAKQAESNYVTPSASTPQPVPSSTSNSLSILKQYLSKMIGYHNQQTTTGLASTVSVSPKLTSTPHQETNIVLDQQLEQALREIEQSSDQSLNEMNNLFNEVDIRRKRREIPEYLTCKLCYDLMRDPVITPCKSSVPRRTTKSDGAVFFSSSLVGITYCRSCIEENLYKVSHLDPIANKPLVVEQLINNLVLKEIIEKFIKENDWVNSECF